MAFSLFKKKVAHAMGSAESNDLVRAQLKKMGDDGAAVRHVLHYAYPKAEADAAVRLEIIADLKARGYAVSDAVHANGLVLEHHRTVASADFDDVTDELSKWFAARGWDYDGWECALVQKPQIH